MTPGTPNGAAGGLAIGFDTAYQKAKKHEVK